MRDVRRTECQLVGDRLFVVAVFWHVASGWGWRLHGVLHSLHSRHSFCLCHPFCGALVSSPRCLIAVPAGRRVARAHCRRVSGYLSTGNRLANCTCSSIEAYFAVTRYAHSRYTEEMSLATCANTRTYVRTCVRISVYVCVRAKRIQVNNGEQERGYGTRKVQSPRQRALYRNYHAQISHARV